eukprot:PLAT14519.1.p2 GENE.PLAT14519.1~~PLAT14519.1.p2  ORF type:complete len:159 (-),score=27.89 PLAT14519.1:62-538(-)
MDELPTPPAGPAPGWCCVYAVYIDTDKTLKQGRRISKEYACEKPTMREVAVCAKELGLPCVMEPAVAYSRDFRLRGRCRIQLVNEAGEVINGEVPTRKALLKRLAVTIPTMERIPDPEVVLPGLAEMLGKRETIVRDDKPRRGKKKGKGRRGKKGRRG